MEHGVDPTTEILNHLDRYGVVDKDRRAAGREKRARRGSPARRRRASPRCTLDLHGMVAEEAERRIRAAVQQCREDGIRELLIIHGWGYHSGGAGPVLKTLVRRMLEGELHHWVVDFVGAPPRDGGEGAVIVRLR